MPKVVFFGSDNCTACRKWLEAYHAEEFPDSVPSHPETKISFVYVDAFSEDNDKICDNNDIDILPRLKIFDHFNRIIFDKEGFFDPNVLWKVMYNSPDLIKQAKAISDSTKQKVGTFNLSKQDK
jgi:hypothetical protein